MCPARRKERGVAILHERLTNGSGTHLNSYAGREAVKYRDVFHTTQPGAKIVPALRVAAEKAPLCVAYMDVGQGREQDAEALLVVCLESLNGSPRALIDAFSATTEAEMKDQQALTGQKI